MQKNSLEKLENIIKNKKSLKLDLQNGIILNLTYDNSIEAYRGYAPDIDLAIGIWQIETLYAIETEKDWGCKLILED